MKVGVPTPLPTGASSGCVTFIVKPLLSKIAPPAFTYALVRPVIVKVFAFGRSVPPLKLSTPLPAPPFFTSPAVSTPPFRFAVPEPAPFVRFSPFVAPATMFTAPPVMFKMPVPASARYMPTAPVEFTLIAPPPEIFVTPVPVANEPCVYGFVATLIEPPLRFKMPGPLRPTATQLPKLAVPPLIVNSPNDVALLLTHNSPTGVVALIVPEVIFTNPRAPAAVPILTAVVLVVRSAFKVPPLIASTPVCALTLPMEAVPPPE